MFQSTAYPKTHETFPREEAANPEPFTGERLTADVQGQVELEHYHRYLFARAYCRDRDVLDVASGEGYGAAHLAGVARFVVGVEYAGATARNAAANFLRDNLCFLQGDARTLPLADASIDVAASFETIEHFDRQEDFVAEIRRVLRPTGCFIVSTPDREIYNPPGSVPNPFHVREFSRREFLDLLHRHFAHVALVRQRPVLASVLIPEDPATLPPLLFQREGDSCFRADTALPDAPYLLALASNAALPAAPFSLLVQRSDLDNVRFEDQRLELLRARHALDAARETIARTEEDARQAREVLAWTQDALARETLALQHVSRSARQFLRQYLPRLWRHLIR